MEFSETGISQCTRYNRERDGNKSGCVVMYMNGQIRSRHWFRRGDWNEYLAACEEAWEPLRANAALWSAITAGHLIMQLVCDS